MWRVEGVKLGLTFSKGEMIRNKKHRETVPDRETAERLAKDWVETDRVTIASFEEIR